jgi:hypothetical protein
MGATGRRTLFPVLLPEGGGPSQGTSHKKPHVCVLCLYCVAQKSGFGNVHFFAPICVMEAFLRPKARADKKCDLLCYSRRRQLFDEQFWWPKRFCATSVLEAVTAKSSR